MSWDSMRELMSSTLQPQEKRSKRAVAGAMARLSVLAGVLVAALLIPATTFVAVTGNDVAQRALELPLALEENPNPQTTKVVDVDGKLIAYFYEQNRSDVPLDQINDTMKNAILAIEDVRFYEHGALDLKGTLRALVNNASDGNTQGGSTITQQLVKLIQVQNATTAEERKAATEKSASRKIRELKHAIAYEEKYTKDEILERYLNIAYFGDGAYGVSAAARHYFSVSPKNLNAAQAATLAGLVKNPNQYNPRTYPERALQRRNTVLAVMARYGFVPEQQARDLQATGLNLKVTSFPNGCVDSDASFSCDYVRRYLMADKDLGRTVDERRARLEQGGLTIRTTIDLSMQKAANKAVSSTIAPKDGVIGALSLVEPGTGAIRAVAQSRPMGSDVKSGQSYINFAVPTKYGDSGGFQGGSTFKFFTTVAALKKGIGVGKTYSSPQTMTVPSGTYFACSGDGTGPWKLKNSTGSGTFNMYRGLRQSVNTYYAQLERDAGLCNTVKAARAMGIDVPEDNEVPSFTLGVTSISPTDLAAAYATAASGGRYCEPVPVAEIIDRDGKSVKKYSPTCERVMSKEVAAQVNDILRGVQEPGGFGYSNGTGLRIPSAAKTGTTNDAQAVWYMGYTPELATASMIAAVNSKGRPVSLVGKTIKGSPISFSAAGGSSLAGPMWAKAMQKIQDELKGKSFDSPPQRQPANPAPSQSSGGGGGGGGRDDDRANRGRDRGDDDRGNRGRGRGSDRD
jgi:membrane peptidoglycan carboxypeptidase